MLSAGSQRSVNSNASRGSAGGKYRRVSRGSGVQEDLFGHAPKLSQKTYGQALAPDAAAISLRELQSLKEQLQAGKTTQAVVLPRSELENIRKMAVVQSKEQQAEEKRLHKEQQDQQYAAAKMRRTRMLQMEEERQAKAPRSELELEDQAKRRHHVERAKDLQMEQHDDVKAMNQMILYSKCVTIRDKQLEEHQNMDQELASEEARLDMLMEVERLKALQFYEAREVQRVQANRQGSLVIQEQIKERDLLRLKEMEIKEREQQQMLKQIRALQQEELVEYQRKKEAGQALLTEVEHANRAAIVIKQKRIEEEKTEEQKIIEYQQARARKEQERLEEIQRVKAEKEREVKRLRDMQERAKDKQAELDALRAKRATETNERAARLKERKEAEYRAKVQQELEAARNQQAQEREIRLTIIAQTEKQEFQRIIEAQKAESEIERQKEAAKVAMRLHHAELLRAQIAENEEVGSQNKRNYLEEGTIVRKQQEEEKRRLLEIKNRKLREMENLEIPQKYRTALSKKKVAVY